MSESSQTVEQPEVPADQADVPLLLQAPQQPQLEFARSQLLQWPGVADASEVQALIDAEFVLAMNSGPREIWGAWQVRRLNELLRWLTQSLWWQQWTGFMPNSPKALPLAEIPILTRKAQREAMQSVGSNLQNPPDLPQEHGEATAVQTGGVHLESNNQPMLVWLSTFQGRMAGAHYRANHFQNGRDPGLAMATLSDLILDHPGAECVAPGSYWLTGENCYAGHAHWGRAWSAGTPSSHAKFLSAHPTPYLTTRAALLSLLLDAYEADPSIYRPQIEQVVTQGEPIDLRLRQRTRAILGARIADVYTCEEIGPIAIQCPHSTDEDPHYHVAVTNCLVQIVKRDRGAPTKFGYLAGEAEHGRVILTGLHQFSSPVLRQDTGDTARMYAECPVCGTRTPTLSDLRSSEHLYLKAPQADGTTVPLPFVRLTGADWQRMLGHVPQDFRLLQIARDHVRVEAVPLQTIQDTVAAQQAVQTALADIIHPALHFELCISERIEWPPEAPVRLRHPVESLLREAPAAAPRA